MFPCQITLWILSQTLHIVKYEVDNTAHKLIILRLIYSGDLNTDFIWESVTCMLTLQSSKSQSVYLLIFKVNQNNLDDVTLFIGDKLVYVQFVTYCRYTVAQMCNRKECLPTRTGMPSCVQSQVKVSSQL